MEPEQVIREKFQQLEPILNEQQKRLWAATEAMHLGYGGVRIVQRATNLSRFTIHIGINELDQGLFQQQIEHMRRKGGGRDSIEETYPELLAELKELLAPCTRGDPMQPLLWTSKSADHLTKELHNKGYVVSDETVARVLHDLGYSLQSNRRTIEGREIPGRDEHLNISTNKLKHSNQSTNLLFLLTPRKKN